MFHGSPNSNKLGKGNKHEATTHIHAQPHPATTDPEQLTWTEFIVTGMLFPEQDGLQNGLQNDPTFIIEGNGFDFDPSGTGNTSKS